MLYNTQLQQHLCQYLEHGDAINMLLVNRKWHNIITAHWQIDYNSCQIPWYLNLLIFITK